MRSGWRLVGDKFGYWESAHHVRANFCHLLHEVWLEPMGFLLVEVTKAEEDAKHTKSLPVNAILLLKPQGTRLLCMHTKWFGMPILLLSLSMLQTLTGLNDHLLVAIHGPCWHHVDPELVDFSDKNHTGINDGCVSSWFCSHPVGPYLWDQEWMTNPYQDRLFHSPHNGTMTSFIKFILFITNDSSHLQQNQATSPQEHHIIIESYSRGLQWDFWWNPQETNQDLGFKTSFKPKLVHL